MKLNQNAEIVVSEESMITALMDRHVKLTEILEDPADILMVEEALEVLRELERECETLNLVKYV